MSGSLPKDAPTLPRRRGVLPPLLGDGLDTRPSWLRCRPKMGFSSSSVVSTTPTNAWVPSVILLKDRRRRSLMLSGTPSSSASHRTAQHRAGLLRFSRMYRITFNQNCPPRLHLECTRKKEKDSVGTTSALRNQKYISLYKAVSATPISSRGVWSSGMILP